MKAAVLKGRRNLVVEDVPDLQPEAGQVLIKVICCGICGSDLHFFDSDRIPAGTIAGHEWVGTISEIGQGVTKWNPGDRVVANGYSVRENVNESEMLDIMLNDPMRVLAMHPAVTAGGFGEYLLWDADRIARVPDNVSDEDAALTDTLNVGFGAVRSSRMRLGDSVSIIGAGPIGLSALLGAKLAGAGTVYVTDLIESRRRIAADLGADEVLDPGQGDVRPQIILGSGGGVDIVIDCVGSQYTIGQSLDLVRVDGTVVLVGLSLKPVEILPLVWFVKNVTYTTRLSGSVPVTLKAMSKKSANTQPFVTNKVPLADIQKAFEGLYTPDKQLKILVYP